LETVVFSNFQLDNDSRDTEDIDYITLRLIDTLKQDFYPDLFPKGDF